MMRASVASAPTVMVASMAPTVMRRATTLTTPTASSASASAAAGGGGGGERSRTRRRRRRSSAQELQTARGGGGGVGFGGGGCGGGAGKEKQKQKQKQQVTWKCSSGCGACCKLEKGPAFPSPEDIFSDHPDFLDMYKSMIGPDGWCIHFHHPTRTCSIYQQRPLFCRVEPEVFQDLYGIPQRRFQNEACSACVDTIAQVYGSASQELKNFNRLIRNGNT